ncbi:MAG: NusA-like transcription termination signal-binding factor [Candidatus Bilamarchaeaceae archaeon]
MEITGEDLKLIRLFESITGVIPSDIVQLEEGLVFLVDDRTIGKAIGKKGVNIQRLRQSFNNRQVLIVRDAPSPEEFLKGFFNNVEILSYEMREAPGQRVAFLTVPDSQRGIAIGKGGLRVKAAKAIMKRKFNADVCLRTKRTA